MIKNSQPFGKNCQKTAGGDYLTHTVEVRDELRFTLISYLLIRNIDHVMYKIRSHALTCSCHSNRSTGCLGNWGTTFPRCRCSGSWRHRRHGYRPTWSRRGPTASVADSQSLDTTRVTWLDEPFRHRLSLPSPIILILTISHRHLIDIVCSTGSYIQVT